MTIPGNPYTSSLSISFPYSLPFDFPIMVPNLHISRDPKPNLRGGGNLAGFKARGRGRLRPPSNAPRNNGSQGLTLQKKVLVFREQWVLGTITGIFQGGVCGGCHGMSGVFEMAELGFAGWGGLGAGGGLF